MEISLKLGYSFFMAGLLTGVGIIFIFEGNPLFGIFVIIMAILGAIILWS